MTWVNMNQNTWQDEFSYGIILVKIIDHSHGWCPIRISWQFEKCKKEHDNSHKTIAKIFYQVRACEILHKKFQGFSK